MIDKVIWPYYAKGLLDKMSEEDGLLYRVIQDPRCGQRKQLVLPQSLKEKVLTSLHNDTGHQGAECTLHLISMRCDYRQS